jgi:predicted dienelactone hydrolase
MITPALLLRSATLGGALIFAVLVSAQIQPAAPPPPLKDAEGRTLRRAPTGHITNYYEDKAGTYTLPDPLVLADGRPVRDADTWFKQRRPELLKRYEAEIYGRVPATAPKVRFEVVEEVPALDGAAVRKRIIGHFGDQPGGPAVNVMLYRPAAATGPLPLVLHITFGGDPVIPLPPGTPPRRSSDMGPVAEVLARGYAYAVVRYTEIQPDNKDGYTGGVIGLALAPGQAKPAPDEWGTIAAWTWGLSRIMDYLATDPVVDAKRVALVGHSRLGKTVLWAGATDARYALIYSSQSGEMGAALSRRDFGETVDDMATNYGYQFAGNLQKYIGHWNDMPHEGHFLIALSAPRPVFISAGSGDLWSDPRGQFLATVAAGPVWRLLGKTDLGTAEMPALDMPVAAGTLAFLEHEGPHVISPLDWKTFLDFAGRHLSPAAKQP